MARRDYMDHLQNVSIFRACSKKELGAVAKQAEEVDIAEGTVLCHEGKSGREFFVIISGDAKVTRNGRKITDLGAGDFFGELSLLDKAPRNATVTATSDMRVVALHRPAFTGLMNEIPSLGAKVAQGLAHRLREADQKIYG